MNRKEKHSRDIKIMAYINLNPMQDERTPLIQRVAKKFGLSTTHVWRIVKQNSFTQL